VACGSYAVLRFPLTLAACLIVLAFMRTSRVTPAQAFAMQLIVASALLDVLSGLGQTVLLGLHRPDRLVYPAALGLLLRAGVGSLLMAAAGLVALSIMWPVAALLGGVILASTAAATVRGLGITGRPRVVRAGLRRLAAALPGFGAVSLLSALEYQLDVILLSIFRSSAAVGIYSSAASIMYIAALAPQAYRTVIFPEFVEKRDRRASWQRQSAARSPTWERSELPSRSSERCWRRSSSRWFSDRGSFLPRPSSGC